MSRMLLISRNTNMVRAIFARQMRFISEKQRQELYHEFDRAIESDKK